MTKSSSGKEEAQLERVLTADENIETALRMLERQQIPGLLPLDSVRKNDSLTVRYTVSGLSSLSAAENREDGLTRLFLVLQALSETEEALSDYFLSSDVLSLKSSEIFLRTKEDEKPQVLFLADPGKEEPFEQSIRELMEFFLKKLNPKSEEEVLLLYGLYQKSREPAVSGQTLYQLCLQHRPKLSEEKTDASASAGEEESLSETMVLYREPGLFLPADQGFQRWKEQQEGTTLLDVGMMPESIQEAANGTPRQGKGRREKPPDRKQEEASAAEDAAQEKMERFRDFFLRHRFELAVAVIIIVGIILFILI